MLTEDQLKEKKNKVDPIVNALGSIGLDVYGRGHNGLGFAISTTGKFKNNINRSLYHLEIRKLTRPYVLEYFLMTHISPLRFHKDINAALNLHLLINFPDYSGLIVEEHPYIKTGRTVWIPVEDFSHVITMYQLNPTLTHGIVQQSFELTVNSAEEFVDILLHG